VKEINEGHKRQAQVYMLSLNIDEGVVMSFWDDVLVEQVTKPTKDRDLAVAQPRPASGLAVPALLKASAEEVYRYFGQEFIYREDAKDVFPVALGVELRLRGCEFTESKRAVLYKGHSVTSHDFEFCFSDGSVAETTFYKKPEKVDEESEELKFYKKAFGLRAACLIAFPEKEKDEVRVVSVWPGGGVRAYIDIETTDLDRAAGELTLVGIYIEHDGQTELVQLYEDSLTKDNLLAALEGTDRLYSYNGADFDLPFIAAKLGVDLADAYRHRDLMYDCWNRNLYGGQKKVEMKLGISRETAGMDGADAAGLWNDYRSKGNPDALKLLLRYNAEDVQNLARIRRKLGVG